MRQSLTKLSNKRWFAVLLCVVGVIASTLLNTRVKLGGECGELFDSFYENSGSEVSIGSQLQSIGNAVTGLAAIAGHYGLDSTAAHDATEQLQRERAGLPAPQQRLPHRRDRGLRGRHDAGALPVTRHYERKKRN